MATMPLTAEQQTSLAQRRNNVMWNEQQLAKAQAAGDTFNIAKYSKQLADEKAAVKALEDIANPPITLTAPVPTAPADSERRARALERGLTAFSDGLKLYAEVQGIMANALLKNSEAMVKFSEGAGGLAEAGFSPAALERVRAAIASMDPA